MSWSIPDKGEGFHDNQSILFRQALEGLMEGLQGVNCVVHGCAVTGGANMTPSVAKGSVLSNSVLFPVTAGTVTIGAADPTNPRFDLIVVTSAGAKAVRAGTAAASPKPPNKTLNDVVLAVVYVPAAATTIPTTHIVDRQVTPISPFILKKQTTPVQFHTTTAIQTYFSVTLPSGLFLAGRQLHVKCGGGYTPTAATTNTLTISYGGTNIYVDAPAAHTASAIRGAWDIDFVLSAEANATQALVGHVRVQTPGTRVAPTTGIAGDMAVVTHVAVPILGRITTVDSDTADRDLLVRWTMSTSAGVGNEITCNYASAALL